ncbi:exodeoxyribonuclease V subunit gamma [Leeia sp. TBRC 13508]|uniref:RecBCD enzyme subunit RecC n=1 Tax=Leeia speluncae TaxID=2884804 RepID=A0ABS8D8E8_9NEIS|nr:exodeoxyribonuclease V subunit gamma [Leeia speluncae]MCB6184479.1 exodeoxyribonuclease V subunit gamma [Leeia speluncae]
MFYLYQSNQLEKLFELLSAVTSIPLSSVFEEEVVVVQSQGMGRWITLQLAERGGICANMRFQLPATFMWQLFCSVNPSLPKRSAFTPEVMAWRIAAILEDEHFLSAHPSLSSYVLGQEPIRRFELAAKIADTFDQYLMYRPDWIDAWAAGRQLNLGVDEKWQQPIWQKLSETDGASHRVKMLEDLLGALKRGEKPQHLPERTIFFAISSMPPVYVEVLHKLSEYIDIALFVLNPCAEPWGHISKSNSQQASLFLEVSKPAGPDEWYVDVDHPLLASLGRQGRDFMDLLIEQHSAVLKDVFYPNEANSLLSQLQNDILHLTTPNKTFDLQSEDDSVQLHICHSPMRELEVLHDQLLRLFDKDPTLKPADVAVLMPDINTYAPLIDAVFSKREGVPYIPYGIADRALQSEQPLVNAFADLLKVLTSRFEVNTVLALLECQAIATKFNLQASDLPEIREWVEAAGIRWGRDAKHKEQLGLPPDELYTWRYGIDRLMLGVILPETSHRHLPLWQQIAPVELAVGKQNHQLAGLYAFVQCLFDWSEKLQAQDRSATQWVEVLHELLEAFFITEQLDDASLQPIRERVTQLSADARLAHYEKEIPVSWLIAWLEQGWKQAYGSTGFLSGGITFCAMVPMRSLPFKAICLLGLNDGDFPRHLQPHSFDLMQRHYRKGDRYRRFDDRYLFLEALLSARSYLYLSYVGTSIRDGSELPPSPLLAEVMDVIEATCAYDDRDKGVPNSIGKPVIDWKQSQLIRHPLQAFDPLYFQGNSRIQSFSAPLAEASGLAGSGSSIPKQWMTQLPIENLPPHELTTWLSCFRNPIRFLMTQRLGIKLPYLEEKLATVEPFQLDWMGKQKVREDLTSVIALQEQNEGVDYSLSNAHAVLPLGKLGKFAYQHEKESVLSALSELVKLPASLPERLPFKLSLSSGVLTGVLGGVHGIRLTSEGLVGGEPDKLRSYHKFTLWIQHLILCALTPNDIPLTSRWVGLDEKLTAEVFQLTPVKEPLIYLDQIAACFHEAWCKPLPFFIKSSDTCMCSFNKYEDEVKALKAASSEWDAPSYRYNAFQRGESENPYYQQMFRNESPINDEFVTLTKLLLSPMYEHAETMKLSGDAE